MLPDWQRSRVHGVAQQRGWHSLLSTASLRTRLLLFSACCSGWRCCP
jgi:hypothetical protein